MKTKTMRFAVRLAAGLLIALFCVLACAGCAKDPDATGTKVAKTTVPIATEPNVDLGGADPAATVAGATIVIAPQGLRFSGTVEKAYLDALKTAYGDCNVKVGFLVAPTDVVNGAIAPAGAETVRLTTDAVITVGTSCHFSCTFPVLEEKNYAESYSFVACVEVNGRILRCAAYSAEQNVASLAGAADAAYLDVSNTRSDKYQFVVTVDGKTKYSPYTAAERETLLEFRFPFASKIPLRRI